MGDQAAGAVGVTERVARVRISVDRTRTPGFDPRRDTIFFPYFFRPSISNFNFAKKISTIFFSKYAYYFVNV